jgi:hypothetical protein
MEKSGMKHDGELRYQGDDYLRYAIRRDEFRPDDSWYLLSVNCGILLTNTTNLTDFVNGDDVRMIERGSRFRLLHEAAHAFLVLPELRREQFERDLAVEPHVLGKINLAPPTCAERGEDLVAIETGANSDDHSGLPQLVI